MKSLIPIIFVLVAAFGETQTAGQLVDTELESLRARVDAIEASNPGTVDLTPIRNRLDALEAQATSNGVLFEDINFAIEELETDIVLVEDELTDMTWPHLIAVQNLEKRDAHIYMRVSMLEFGADPTGDLTKCWDTGGVPDRDNGVCICPVMSTWADDTDPDDGKLEQGCRWDEGIPSEESPVPDGVEPEPQTVPDPTACAPTTPAPDAQTCSWNLEKCDWVCQ